MHSRKAAERTAGVRLQLGELSKVPNRKFHVLEPETAEGINFQPHLITCYRANFQTRLGVGVCGVKYAGAEKRDCG